MYNVGDEIYVDMFDGCDGCGCFRKVAVRYVEEVGDDYVIVNCKKDLSGKTHKKVYKSKELTHSQKDSFIKNV